MDPRKRAKDRLRGLEQSLSNVLVVHYSCESFIDKPDGYSPRVSAIGVRNLDSGQTYSFSIHRVAELNGIPREGTECHYDDLEKKMLDGFFNFVSQHKSHTYVHWNMRDTNYGFQALYHRYQVLGGVPAEVDETQLVDLARILVDIYGSNYAEHPRLVSIINLNGITKRHYLTGAQEAEAFANKEYIRLHLSTLCKVDCIAHLLTLTLTGKLKVSMSPLALRVRDAHDSWAFKGVVMILAAWGLVSVANTVGRAILGIVVNP